MFNNYQVAQWNVAVGGYYVLLISNCLRVLSIEKQGSIGKIPCIFSDSLLWHFGEQCVEL